MKKRTLTFVTYGLVTACLAWAPLTASLYYSRSATVAAAEQSTAHLAQEVSMRAAEVLLSAEAVLGGLAYDARRGCRPSFVDELRNAVVLVAHIRSVAYVSDDGQVECSSFGLADGEELFEKIDSVTAPGAVVSFSEPVRTEHVPGVHIVAIHRLKSGASLHVLIDPQAFVDRFDLTGLGGDGRIEVRLLDRLLASRGPPMPSGKSFISMTEEVGLYGAAVSVSISSDWALQGWVDEAVVYGALGLVTSGILVAGALVLLRRRLSLTGRLQQAIRNEELEVHYQPVIDIQRNRCVGAEALVRWRDPERGLLRPDLFIALAEETGLILPITDWLIHRVVSEMKPLLAGDSELHVAINLAPVHFKPRPMAGDIVQVFRDAGVDLKQIVFEVTERGLIDDPESHRAIDELRRQGAAVALDDFGTGYSNLSYLQDFKIDYLKIDQRFIAAIDSEAPTAGLAAMIIDLAKTLDVTIIAEGIETQAQVAYLREKGVRYVQGWHFTQPLPAADFPGYLARFNSGDLAARKRDTPLGGVEAPASA